VWAAPLDGGRQGADHRRDVGARRCGVGGGAAPWAAQQLFAWRREARKRASAIGDAAPTFVPAVVEPRAPEEQTLASPRRGRRKAKLAAEIEVEIDGATVRIGRGANASAIGAVIRALKSTR
jgi:transposase